MNFREVMKELESMGTAQNRKVYARHGVGQKMFGVSYANLGKLKKKIKVDHCLALKLWESGIHDARVLATMIADPGQVDHGLLESWIKELDNYVLACAFSGLAGRTALAGKKLEKWIKSRNEWTGSVGWNLLTGLAMGPVDVPDSYFENYLEVIESQVLRSKNRVRHGMNMALISIGLRNSALEKKAVAAAKRIGPVEVDHGETGCKTPDAVAYIKKAKARRKRC